MVIIENIIDTFKRIFNNDGIGVKEPEKNIEVLVPPKEKEVDLSSMTKKELETYGKGLGIELDRRHSKKKLIKNILAANEVE